jgi:hypothetical protein
MRSFLTRPVGRNGSGISQQTLRAMSSFTSTLWASANIDAVAFDNYWPLSDWRDTPPNIDQAVKPDGTLTAITDYDYLMANVRGEEGYAWFYASQADRAAQRRTPITDGAYSKAWVFRYKYVWSWWSNQHFNRPGGIESASPTDWVPKSKPIWFTELGCPSIDKGSNQPNVFYDPKSSENAIPYFSSAASDTLIRRRASSIEFIQGAPIASVSLDPTPAEAADAINALLAVLRSQNRLAT